MEAKQYAAVLTGAMRRLTEDDVSISAERIKQEVFPELALEGSALRGKLLLVDHLIDVTKLFDLTLQLMQQAVKENYELTELEAALTAAKVTTVQLETFVRFWKAQRAKLHEWARKRTAFSGVLSQLQWRIDYKRVSKSVAEINQPVAIMELTFNSSRKGVEGEKSIVRFEMDKEKLRMLQGHVEAIQKRIHDLAGSQP